MKYCSVTVLSLAMVASSLTGFRSHERLLSNLTLRVN
jgi:hypothetical protein